MPCFHTFFKAFCTRHSYEFQVCNVLLRIKSTITARNTTRHRKENDNHCHNYYFSCLYISLDLILLPNAKE